MDNIKQNVIHILLKGVYDRADARYSLGLKPFWLDVLRLKLVKKLI